eukprot:COSAG01_NODE_26785_length_703_cov_1.276490_1_plen_122_part_00
MASNFQSPMKTTTRDCTVAAANLELHLLLDSLAWMKGSKIFCCCQASLSLGRMITIRWTVRHDAVAHGHVIEMDGWVDGLSLHVVDAMSYSTHKTHQEWLRLARADRAYKKHGSPYTPERW